MPVVMSSNPNLLAGSVMRSALHVAEMVKQKTDTVAAGGYRERKTEVFTETRADLHNKHGPGPAGVAVP